MRKTHYVFIHPLFSIMFYFHKNGCIFLMYFFCFKGVSNEEMYSVWHEILRDLILANFTDLISFYSVFTPLLFINRLFQVYDKSNKM